MLPMRQQGWDSLTNCREHLQGKMKVKLIAPAKKPEWGESFWDLKTLCQLTRTKTGGIPLALPTLAALTPQDVEVTITDENVEPIDYDEPVDLVGISFLTSLAPRAYEIADEFRVRNIPVVLGGIHASMLPEEAIQHADSVVIGEAEEIWPKLIDGFRLGELQKFYRASNFPSLEYSPMPRWGLLKSDSYCFFSVQTGRGCPHNCNFCSVTAFNGHKYRHKPIENVIKEIRTLKQIDPRKPIFFADDNILAIPNYAGKLFEALIPFNIRWECQASINRLGDGSLLELMYQSGCRQIFVGFESVSQKSLDLMNKGKVNKVEEYVERVEKVHSHGIAVCGSFMVGSDADDQTVFKNTIKFIDDTNMAFSMINVLTPAPGTDLYRRLEMEKRLLDKHWWEYDGESVCFKPHLMSAESLERGRNQVLRQIYSYGAFYKRLSNLWTKGVLVRNRDASTNLFTKGRIFFTLRSLLNGNINDIYFSLRGLWNQKGTSIMSILVSVNFHKYAYSLSGNINYRGAVMARRKDVQRKQSRGGTIKLILEAIRDLLIRFLPRRVVESTMKKGEFAFLAHPLESSDMSKKYSFLEDASARTLQVLTKYLWPIVVCQITGFKTRTDTESKGWIVACPLTAKQMIENSKLAKKKVLQAIHLAEKLGANIVGLGAFSSIVTHGGLDLVGKVRAGLTTGNAYAAALIIQNVMRIADLVGLNMENATAAIVGAAGSVGSACSEVLLRKVGKLLLVDEDSEGLKNLVEKIGGDSENLKASTQLDVIRDVNIVIAVASATEGIIMTSHLVAGTIVVDAAQPSNVHEEVLRRKDILVINSGIAKVPGISYGLSIGLNKEEVYACLGEVLMLVWRGRKEDYSLGKVDPRLVDETLKMADEIGICPAEFRNSAGWISNEDIQRIQKYYAH